MKGFGEKILNTCEQFTSFQLSVMPVMEFAHITVEPIEGIRDNEHEADPVMVEGIFQHLKYHRGRK